MEKVRRKIEVSIVAWANIVFDEHGNPQEVDEILDILEINDYKLL